MPTTKLKQSSLSLFVAVALSTCVSSVANAANIDQKAQLEKVTVTDKDEVIVKIKKNLSKIAGGTNAINLDDMPTSKATLYDVLAFEPGVMMQEFFGGNDQPRINIRGSGIQANPVNSGLQLLFDGIPINQADGSFVIGLIDPLRHHAISIYRGANAMRYGGASLGGAINYVPKSALNSDSYVNIEAGSFGTQNVSIGIGDQKGKFDYYINGGFSQTDGYRKVSDGERKNFSLNIGYQISDNIENRTYLHYTDNFFHIPFVLQKKTSKDHPKSVIGDGYATNFPGPFTEGTPPKDVWDKRGGWDGIFDINKRKPFRDTQSLRVANKTTIKQNNGAEHQISIYGEDMDDTFADPLTHEVAENTNFGINLYTKGKSLLFKTGTYQLSLAYSSGSMPTEYWVSNANDGSKVFKYGDFDRDADNLALNFQCNVLPTKNTEIVADLQYIRNTRDISGSASTPASQGGFTNTDIIDYDKEYTFSAFNPKLGVIVNTSNTHKIYTNISGSMEAPTFNQIINRSVVPLVLPGSTMPPFTNPALASGANLVDLEEQTAITYEVGSTGSWNNLNWQASYYYSQVKDELITQVDVIAVNGSTTNYPDDTVHQGLELGINAQLTNNLFKSDDSISTKVVYNYNSFTFESGEFDGNDIAGIPKQTLFIEVAYALGDYFLIAPNIKIQPDETYADHSNIQQQDSFNLVGLKASYKPKPNLNIYVDLQNITDETYNTTYVVRGKSGPASPTFLPGSGFNASLGLNYTW